MMKKSSFAKKIFFLVSLSLFLQFSGISQVADRFFDTATVSKAPRLVVLYPSLGTIKALLDLRNNGLIKLENIEVVGVYYDKEKTNYQESKDFVTKNNLTWFKFHRLSGELKEDALFARNIFSSEFEGIFKKSDGIIFFGGPDIPPSIFKEKTLLLTDIEDPCRHFLELSFIFHLLGGFQDENFSPLLKTKPEYPILGICLGSQSLNVGTGGTLVQDIWQETYGKIFLEDILLLDKEAWHSNPYNRLYPQEKFFPHNMHAIKFVAKSRFAATIGADPKSQPYVLSAHHQQVEKPGKGFRIAATSLDGKVVEAIEHEEFANVFGVQFHPEYHLLWTDEVKFRFTPQDQASMGLKTFLANHPPSFEFHRQTWNWLSQKLLKIRNKYRSSR